MPTEENLGWALDLQQPESPDLSQPGPSPSKAAWVWPSSAVWPTLAVSSFRHCGVSELGCLVGPVCQGDHTRSSVFVSPKVETTRKKAFLWSLDRRVENPFCLGSSSLMLVCGHYGYLHAWKPRGQGKSDLHPYSIGA